MSGSSAKCSKVTRQISLLCATFPDLTSLLCVLHSAMGQQPTEEELFQMISEVDEDMSGAIGDESLAVPEGCFVGVSASRYVLVVDFAEFLQVIDNQKDRAAMFEDDSDMSTVFAADDSGMGMILIFLCAAVDAFVACGGKPDKTGFVRKETLVKIIKGDFGLTINI
jgi:hypothetical protein